jgi:hypothetical protein
MSADEGSVEDQSFEVTIAVDDRHVGDLDAVASRLREAGLSVENVLAEIGVITGRTDEEHAASLADVEGVAHVERSREYQLAPPDSEIQ